MSWAGAGGGAATGAAIGSFGGPIGTGVGAGIGALLGAFSGNKKQSSDPEFDALMSHLTSLSDTTQKQGTSLATSGAAQLAPVLDYFKKLSGNDPSAVLDATKPERGRVIDQYDTARSAIANFAPRGGGSNAAAANSYTSEANQLGDITSTARSNAIGQSAQLGTTLEGLGLSADQLANADLSTIVNAILAKQGLALQASGQNKALAGGLSEGLGTLLGLYLTRKGGAPGPSGSPTNGALTA